jgi:hypothetical protein
MEDLLLNVGWSGLPASGRPTAYRSCSFFHFAIFA